MLGETFRDRLVYNKPNRLFLDHKMLLKERALEKQRSRFLLAIWDFVGIYSYETLYSCSFREKNEEQKLFEVFFPG